MLKAAHMTFDRTTDRDIVGLTSDSRLVRPGFLFAAFPGAKSDGRAFIAEALARGAVAILAPEGTALDGSLTSTIPLITDPVPRKRFAHLAAVFHGRQPATAMAVTGTNGKTSVAHFTQQIWAALGRNAGYLGTLGAWGGSLTRDGSLTTPDTVVLHEILRAMADGGVTHLAMEISSHGLDQCRADGVKLSVAAFTNLTRDHLDYHGSMEAYRAAKARLFTEVLPSGGVAVLNADSAEFSEIEAICRRRGIRVIDYGIAATAIRLIDCRPGATSQTIALAIGSKQYRIELPLVGRFQASNALCALGCVIAADNRDTDAAVAALSHLNGVPGRMQLAGTHACGAPVYIDYAHTPDALETVLTALRPHVGSRLAVVFGCGGDRDRGKRPIMGERARVLADDVVVTDDNPRSEDAAAIRAQVMAGCPGAAEIADRETAIAAAIARLTRGDILLIAGKGHEQGQIVGDRVLPFSDLDMARKHLGVPGAVGAGS